MSPIITSLNNREISTIIWTAIVIAIMLWYTRKNESIRQSLALLIKTALAPKLVSLFLFYSFFICTVCYLLERIGVWDFIYLKETLLWSIFTGISLVAKGIAVRNKQNLSYKGVIRDQLKIGALIVFIVGLKPFSLPIELILIPVTTFITLLLEITKQQKEIQHKTKLISLFTWILGVIGFILFWHSLSSTLETPEILLSWSTMRSFMLPISLTISVIPFAYIISIYSTFEHINIHMNYGPNNFRDLKFYSTIKFILLSRLNPNKLRRMNTLVANKVTWAENHDQIDHLFNQLEETMKDSEMIHAGDFDWHPRSNPDFSISRFTSNEDYSIKMRPIAENTLNVANQLFHAIGLYTNNQISHHAFQNHMGELYLTIESIDEERQSLPLANGGLRPIHDALYQLHSGSLMATKRLGSYNLTEGSIEHFNALLNCLTEDLPSHYSKFTDLWEERFGEPIV